MFSVAINYIYLAVPFSEDIIGFEFISPLNVTTTVSVCYPVHLVSPLGFLVQYQGSLGK
jgi:hypothetical protein